MHVVRLRFLFLVLTAVLAVACGQGTPLSSPTAPTGMPSSAALTIDGDADAWATASTADEFAGLGNGKDKGKQDDKDKGDRGKGGLSDDDNEAEDDDDDDDGENNHGSRRELSGFVTAVGTDSITVRGITVKIVAGTIIRHGHRTLTIADIEVGDHAQARGTMSADGTTLTASEIKVEDTDNDDDEDDAKVEGAVSALSGTCPAVTFTVGTTKVTTNASTTFEDVTCATLANGMAVEVKGARQTDGSILASKVERELDEVEGTVSALSGTCPALTFNVGTTKVTTSSTTTFKDGTCATVANDKKVEVKGTKQSDGSIAAVSVEFD